MSTTTTTAVYLIWNRSGELVYIGETYRDRIQRRWNEHVTTQPWGSEIDVNACRVYGIYPTKQEARLVEKSLIQHYKPRYNRVHNPTSHRWKTAYTAHRRRTVAARLVSATGTFTRAFMYALLVMFTFLLAPGRGRRSSFSYRIAKNLKKSTRRSMRRRRAY